MSFIYRITVANNKGYKQVIADGYQSNEHFTAFMDGDETVLLIRNTELLSIEKRGVSKTLEERRIEAEEAVARMQAAYEQNPTQSALHRVNLSKAFLATLQGGF